MEKKIILYNVKNLAQILFAVIVAFIALLVIYRLLINETTKQFIGQVESPSIEFGISVITITAPLFAIIESLISLLKNIRDNRLKAELIKVVEALSKSPARMDISALESDSGLPKKILLERINELILLGRVAVKMTPKNNREYSLAT